MWLSSKIEFPPYETTNNEGVIALGGDLSSERLLHAYKNGIFPWFSEGEPIVWYCPWRRMVLFPDEVKISKSMKKVLQQKQFLITENEAFIEVIQYCKNTKRKDGFGTWITDEMEQAYCSLHKQGHAKSIEVWQSVNEEKTLVGGLYGVVVNGVFCGESMFSKVSNASKVAFFYLARQKKYSLIDCQMYNAHLASLGAKEIPRNAFLTLLKMKG